MNQKLVSALLEDGTCHRGANIETAMTISISFFGQQRVLAGADRVEVEISADSRVTDILFYLKRRYPELQVREDNVLVTVNNRICSFDELIKSR